MAVVVVVVEGEGDSVGVDLVESRGWAMADGALVDSGGGARLVHSTCTEKLEYFMSSLVYVPTACLPVLIYGYGRFPR